MEQMRRRSDVARAGIGLAAVLAICWGFAGSVEARQGELLRERPKFRRQRIERLSEGRLSSDRVSRKELRANRRAFRAELREHRPRLNAGGARRGGRHLGALATPRVPGNQFTRATTQRGELRSLGKGSGLLGHGSKADAHERRGHRAKGRRAASERAIGGAVHRAIGQGVKKAFSQGGSTQRQLKRSGFVKDDGPLGPLIQRF